MRIPLKCRSTTLQSGQIYSLCPSSSRLPVVQEKEISCPGSPGTSCPMRVFGFCREEYKSELKQSENGLIQGGTHSIDRMWTFSEGKSAPKVWGWEFLWVGEFPRIASGKNILAILRKGRGVSGAGSLHIFWPLMVSLGTITTHVMVQGE